MSSLVSHLDAECLRALELAKQALPAGQRLDVGRMLDAVYHATSVRQEPELAELAHLFSEPIRLHDRPPPSPVDEALKVVLARLRTHAPVPPRLLLAFLAESSLGQQQLAQRGATDEQLAVLTGPVAGTLRDTLTATVLTSVPTATTRQASGGRRQMLHDLGEFGTMLTEPPGPAMFGPKVVPEHRLRLLLQPLCTPRSRNILLIGPPGTGKTSLVQALALRILQGDSILPPAVAELDLFELSPTFPRLPDADITPFSQQEDMQRVSRLLRLLQRHPRVVLCVERLPSLVNLLFRLSIHQELLDGFRYALETGSITCIGGAHPEDIDRINELDRSLLRRFRVLHVPPPTAEEVAQILEGRLQRLQDYFKPLEVPVELLPRAVALGDEHLRDRPQPEKSIRLLEAACARASLETPRPERLTETHLLQALEGFAGPVVLPDRALSAEGLYEQLREHIVGQDEGLSHLARAVVAGRADKGWFLRPGPRGVFLLGGPTGVGKTETAVLLARVLGGGRDALVRVDCQNLQGSGSGWEANPLTWRLLGVPPGYRGHVPGCRDGMLVKVRDYPECVLLLDEFEKADPVVGRLLLRILDEGKAQDSEGNDLDFRRSFVILTSNAGVTYTDPERGHVGFMVGGAAPRPTATVSEQAISDTLLASGLGQEFLARVQHVILFNALETEQIRQIVGRQLTQLLTVAVARGKTLTWTDGVIDRLTGFWQSRPQFGARYLGTLVRTLILDPINIAAAGNELEGVAEIALDVGPESKGRPASQRHRDGDRLRIVIS